MYGGAAAGTLAAMPPARFRRDVEGLRGLAIVLVVLAHAGVGAAAGGFVGVDVFFVISGFVITQLLVGERAVTSPRCVYGDGDSKKTVVLFGDSHAMQYFPALERLARRRHWRLVQLTKGGCPPPRVKVVYTLSDREYDACGTWREHALRRIERDERPRLVIAATSAHYTVLEAGERLDRDAGARALGAGYAPTLRRLEASVPKVAVIADAPRPPFDVPTCVSAALEQLRRCAFPAGRSLARSRVVTAAVRRVEGVRVIDPTSQFCLRDLCPSVIGNVLVYRNSGHVTASFVETLTGWLGRQLPRP
jgi:hypothetical protein